jgi:hypothetical protein
VPDKIFMVYEKENNNVYFSNMPKNPHHLKKKKVKKRYKRTSLMTQNLKGRMAEAITTSPIHLPKLDLSVVTKNADDETGRRHIEEQLRLQFS